VLLSPVQYFDTIGCQEGKPACEGPATVILTGSVLGNRAHPEVTLKRGPIKLNPSMCVYVE